MDPEVHKRLKHFAVEHDCTMGGAIRRLLESYHRQPNFRCESYRRWLGQVVAAGREGGDAAAERFMRDNPFMG
jgi:hypothetical protein